MGCLLARVSVGLGKLERLGGAPLIKPIWPRGVDQP